MIYLASPYSDPDPRVREERFEAACRKASEMIAGGLVVFSPIAHSHCIAIHGGIAGDWDTWKRQARGMLELAQELWVLRLPGWESSVGIKAEMHIAHELGAPIILINPNDRKCEVLYAGKPQSEALRRGGFCQRKEKR